VLGTRPEAVKLAPVIRALAAAAPAVETRVCVTGQHREMLDPILRLFDIVPDVDLALMSRDQKLSQLSATALVEVERIVEDAHPDWVIVQGDTTTAMAASLATFYQGVQLAHVEAGLRTNDKRRPFPEEANRKIVDVLADLRFAPTSGAAQNLVREGFDPATIFVTGNTVIDALLEVCSMPYDDRAGPLSEIPFDRRVVLVTAHRRESFGPALEGICAGIRALANEQEDIHIAYPVHLNPNVSGPVRRLLGDHPRISLLPPLEYQDLVQLLRRSTLVLTDSGGIQEEAPSLRKPVLVLRDVTERPEAVEAGCARIVGTDPTRIVAEARHLLSDADAYRSMACSVNPFGDGRAAQRIVRVLLSIASQDEPPSEWGVAAAVVRRPLALSR
jgi:UDP-N-acetylglucosamine 2-epimerase (non-hydrolysing)